MGWVEDILYIVDGIGLCFVFVLETVLITKGWPNRVYTEESGGLDLRGDRAGTATPTGPRDIPDHMA